MQAPLQGPPATRKAHRYAHAPHLRGRVHAPVRVSADSERAEHFWHSLINTATGATLMTTDEFSLEAASAACSRVVAVARDAWFYGLNYQTLAEGQRETIKIDAQDATAILSLISGEHPEDLEGLVAKCVTILGQ